MPAPCCSIGWGVGDPHINTVDGANYTFNGWGEYTLFTAGGFSLQGRTTPVNLTVSDSATQWSAFAFGSREDTFVEVSNLLRMHGYTVKPRLSQPRLFEPLIIQIGIPPTFLLNYYSTC